jgi:hypothetical protein
VTEPPGPPAAGPGPRPEPLSRRQARPIYIELKQQSQALLNGFEESDSRAAPPYSLTLGTGPSRSSRNGSLNGGTGLRTGERGKVYTLYAPRLRHDWEADLSSENDVLTAAEGHNLGCLGGWSFNAPKRQTFGCDSSSLSQCSAQKNTLAVIHRCHLLNLVLKTEDQLKDNDGRAEISRILVQEKGQHRSAEKFTVIQKNFIRPITVQPEVIHPVKGISEG